MSPHLHPLGYRRITVDGKQTGVHQLVAAAFHGPCPEGMEVDHINDVRDDNRPENLQYLTRQQNLLLRNLPRLGDVCGEGHPLTGDNLYVRPSTGRRECKICAKERHGRRVFVEPCSASDGCDRYATCDLKTAYPLMRDALFATSQSGTAAASTRHRHATFSMNQPLSCTGTVNASRRTVPASLNPDCQRGAGFFRVEAR